MARRRCGNAADADDLVQETFVRALQGLADYDDRGNLCGWLVAILNHLHLDRCRKAARAPRLEDIDAHELAIAEPSEPPLWTTMPIERVHDTLAVMPPALRTTFELYARGLSYDEIARELRIPKNTVGTRLIRTRRRIKRLLLAAA
ncbi:MAG: sigma-70 family RNA polymerase sigma factor [Myxococcota bacterium]|nr:sigma-70 family RNA polymerase sigma factor [Deltaproteobacteria bacterium]MDQ3341570.1 sigma-70 family RNA polymerase sigma factor [Myxococcota bacterium]